MNATIEQITNIINNEFEFCNASIEEDIIEVGYRAKKSNKIYIENGAVSFIGNCNDIACKIADRFELVKNF